MDISRLDIKTVNGQVRIKVRVAPRAGKTGVAGLYDNALKVRLAAPPVDGAANGELISCFAKLFKRPKSSIKIVAGHKSKSKLVDIAGMDIKDVLNMINI